MTENQLGDTLNDGIANLHPAYFSLVMATGIVSIAGYLLGMELLAWPLFTMNLVFYAILWFLLIGRLVKHFPRVLADLTDHKTGAGFFTLVAGTNVLGSQFVLLASDQQMGLILWVVGFVLWLLLIYAFFTLMTVKEQKPALESGINGAWLIVVVSTQSVAVLGALIASSFGVWEEAFFFLVLCFYLLGCMFYLLIISLIFYRFMFFKLDPQELTPPYWINMGAVAITTLAGANIILKGDHPFIQELLPFIKGFTLFFWATGSWWIPLLLIFGAWRHITKRYPLSYHPLYWGLVFPLGMYTVCTFQLAKALELDFLFLIPQTFVYIAIFAWLVTFIGLVIQLAKKFFRFPAQGI